MRERFHIVVTSSLRINHIVYDQSHASELYKIYTLGAWKYIKRPIYSERHHRQLKFIGKEERTVLERYHLAVKRSGALGEYH